MIMKNVAIERKMTQDVFNVVQSTPTPRGHAQRMKHVRSDQKVQKYKHNVTYTKKNSFILLLQLCLW